MRRLRRKALSLLSAPAAVYRQNVRLRIRRSGEAQELEMMVGSREVVTYRIVDGGSPTLEQLRVREGWLKR